MLKKVKSLSTQERPPRRLEASPNGVTRPGGVHHTCGMLLFTNNYGMGSECHINYFNYFWRATVRLEF